MGMRPPTEEFSCPPTWRHRSPCWIDLFTSSVDRGVAFYRGMFGWAAETAGTEYGGRTAW